MSMKNKLAKVFDWGKAKTAKKTVFFFNEGSEDDNSKYLICGTFHVVHLTVFISVVRLVRQQRI